MATYAVVLSWPYSKDKLGSATALYDAINSYVNETGLLPDYPFDLMIVQGDKIAGTVVVAFFSNSAEDWKQEKGVSLTEVSNAIAWNWLKTAAGDSKWTEIEYYGPKFWGIESYWGPVSILKQCRIHAAT